MHTSSPTTIFDLAFFFAVLGSIFGVILAYSFPVGVPPLKLCLMPDFFVFLTPSFLTFLDHFRIGQAFLPCVLPISLAMRSSVLPVILNRCH